MNCKDCGRILNPIMSKCVCKTADGSESPSTPGYKDVVAKQERMLEIATAQIIDLMGVVPNYFEYNDERKEYLTLLAEVEEIKKSL